jgi:hypothetical protein
MTSSSPSRRPHALVVEDEILIALGLTALGIKCRREDMKVVEELLKK